MCGFTFTVFLFTFQLLPTAPYHIIDLGGSTATAGLFLGFLTYSSAFSAPLTGAVADRIGQRRILILASLALAVFSATYAVLSDVRIMLAVAIVHGIFWSGLLSAASAYMTNLLPEHRRAEGIGYWGLSTLLAVAVSPTVGFWIYKRGWIWVCGFAAILNLIMATIAWRLKEHPRTDPVHAHPPAGFLEWRVLIVSITLALYSFGYGGITSFAALYADANGVTPKGLYLTAFAIVILATRPILGRLGDRIGYKQVFIPCLILISCGMALLSLGGSRPWMLLSALVFGVGYGTAYPTYVGYVMRGVRADRRGAAFGAILAAFDTGIGTGSTLMGWIIDRHGFASGFGTAAALSALALPYFLVVDKWYTTPST